MCDNEIPKLLPRLDIQWLQKNDRHVSLWVLPKASSCQGPVSDGKWNAVQNYLPACQFPPRCCAFKVYRDSAGPVANGVSDLYSSAGTIVSRWLAFTFQQVFAKYVSSCCTQFAPLIGNLRAGANDLLQRLFNLRPIGLHHFGFAVGCGWIILMNQLLMC